jgi:anti-anti-sigma factor
MNDSGYISEYFGENSEFALVKLSNSVLGGNDALDFTNLINQLISQNVKCVVVDAGNVEIMNSTGIGMLANAHSNLTKNGLLMLLVSVPEKILKLLRMTHLDRVFKFYDNLDEALLNCKFD